MMPDSTVFLIYAALYRLTVLAVGALSIWLGFRLFGNAEKTDKGEVRSEIQQMRYHNESNLDRPAARGEKSGITEAEAAEMMEAIAKLLRKNGHEEEAVKTEQAAASLRRNGQ